MVEDHYTYCEKHGEILGRGIYSECIRCLDEHKEKLIVKKIMKDKKCV